MAKTTIELPEVLHRKLRVKAAVESCSMNDIVVAALQHHLRTFRLDPELLEVETVPSNGEQQEVTSNV